MEEEVTRRLYEKYKNRSYEIKDRAKENLRKIDEVKKTDRYKDYEGTDNIYVKEKEYSDIFQLFKEKEGLQEELDNYFNEYKSQAETLYSIIVKKIEKINEKLKINENSISEIEEENKEYKQKIDEITSSEEYKSGDEKLLNDVEIIKEKIKANNRVKNKIKKSIVGYKKELESLSIEKENLEKEIELLSKINSKEEKTEKTDEEKTSHDDEKDKPESKKESKSRGGVGYGIPVTPSDESEDKTKEDKEKEDATKEETTETKEKIDSIVKKIKSNLPINDEESKVIAEVLSDPSKYEEYGISKGLFTNKGKILLHELAKDVRRSTVSAYEKVKQSKEALGNIDYEKADGKEVMKTISLLKWRKVKELINDPDKEIGGERHLRKVVEANEGKELSGDAKVAFEEAKKCLAKYDSLRKASKTYGEVAIESQKKDNRFITWFKNLKVPKLNEGKEEKEHIETKHKEVEVKEKVEPKDSTGFWEYLEGEVKEEIDNTEAKSKTTAPIEKDEP